MAPLSLLPAFLLLIGDGPPYALICIGAAVVCFFALIAFAALTYRRCPPNKVLVKFGSVGKDQTVQCIHGGGVYIIPKLQGCAFLSLTPIDIAIHMTGVPTRQNGPVQVQATVGVAISTKPELLNTAAERLLDLNDQAIAQLAEERIQSVLRQLCAGLALDEITRDPDRFRDLLTQGLDAALGKLGLEVNHIHIRDIAADSGPVAAPIGKTQVEPNHPA